MTTVETAPSTAVLEHLLESTTRVVIGGGPCTGKTQLSMHVASVLGVTARHTDDLIGHLDWSGASEEVSRWMAEPGPWVIEGVATVRALRKALTASPAAPCTILHWLSGPFEPLTKGQLSMTKGCDTVLAGIRPELEARGVLIVEGVQ